MRSTDFVVYKLCERYAPDRDIVSVPALVYELKQDRGLCREFEEAYPKLDLRDDKQVKKVLARYLTGRGYKRWNSSCYAKY